MDWRRIRKERLLTDRIEEDWIVVNLIAFTTFVCLSQG